MSRKKRLGHPAAFGLFAWQAGMVFAVRGTKLLTDPDASRTLSAMALEKQRAFAQGTVNAVLAGMRGSSATEVAAAGLSPSKRRVKANFKALGASPARPRKRS